MAAAVSRILLTAKNTFNVSHIPQDPFCLFLRVNLYSRFIWMSCFIVMYCWQYFKALFFHSVNYFENMWLTITSTCRKIFRWTTLLGTFSTSLQFTNWANIGFGPRTLLLVCVTSLSVPRYVLLICISNSSYVYGRLNSDVKSPANIFEVPS